MGGVGSSSGTPRRIGWCVLLVAGELQEAALLCIIRLLEKSSIPMLAVHAHPPPSSASSAASARRRLVFSGGYQNALAMELRLLQAQAAGESALSICLWRSLPSLIVRVADTEATPRGTGEGSVHSFRHVCFERQREGEPQFVCSCHGKRGCIDRRYVEVVAAVVEHREPRLSTRCPEADRLHQFDVLLADQGRRNLFRSGSSGAEEDLCRKGELEAKDGETGVALQEPPVPTSALTPSSYDVKLRAAGLRCLQHPTPDALASFDVLMDGGVVNVRDACIKLQENHRHAIHQARCQEVRKSCWLLGDWGAQQQVQVATEPNAIWQSLRVDLARPLSSRTEEPERHPSPQWISSADGELHPFHAAWQHATRHELGLLYTAMLESATDELERRAEKYSTLGMNDTDWCSPQRNHGAPSSFGSIALDAFQAWSGVVEVRGRSAAEECALRLRAQLTTPTGEPLIFEDLIPMPIWEACVINRCMDGLPKDGGTKPLEQLAEGVPEGWLSTNDPEGRLEELHRLLQRAVRLQLLGEVGGDPQSGHWYSWSSQCPPSSAVSPLLALLQADLFALVAQSCSSRNVEAFAMLLNLSCKLDAHSGALKPGEDGGGAPELPREQRGGDQRRPTCAARALRMESLWPPSLAAQWSGASLHASSALAADVILRSGADEETGAPKWLACRCSIHFCPQAEALTFSYQVPGAHPAVPGLPQIVWLTGARSMRRQDNFVALPCDDGGSCIIVRFLDLDTGAACLLSYIERLEAALSSPGLSHGELELLEGASEADKGLDAQQREGLYNSVAPPASMDEARSRNLNVWLVAAVGGGALLQVIQHGSSGVARLAAAATVGRSAAGGRAPQRGEAPHIMKCGSRQTVELAELVLEVWMAPSSAALPPQVRRLGLIVSSSSRDRLDTFTSGVSSSCAPLPRNIRPSLPPPPKSADARKVVEAARSVLKPLGGAAALLLRRLIFILDRGCAGQSCSARVLLEHQRSILQPPPVSAHRRVRQLAEGQRQLSRQLVAVQTTEDPLPLVTQQLSGTYASAPRSLGGASPAGLARLLRGGEAYEAVLPWEYMDGRAACALSPPSSVSASDVSREDLLRADKGWGEATPEHPCSVHKCPIFPSKLVPSIKECVFCGGALRLVGPKIVRLITPHNLVFVRVFNKQCVNRSCGVPYVPLDVRDTCGLVCAHKIVYPMNLEVARAQSLPVWWSQRAWPTGGLNSLLASHGPRRTPPPLLTSSCARSTAWQACPAPAHLSLYGSS